MDIREKMSKELLDEVSGGHERCKGCGLAPVTRVVHISKTEAQNLLLYPDLGVCSYCGAAMNVCRSEHSVHCLDCGTKYIFDDFLVDWH